MPPPINYVDRLDSNGNTIATESLIQAVADDSKKKYGSEIKIENDMNKTDMD